MMIAAKMGERIGITVTGTAGRIGDVLRSYDLPLKTDLPAADILSAISSDKKKFSDTVYFVLLKEIGEAVLYPVLKADLDMMLTEVLD